MILHEAWHTLSWALRAIRLVGVKARARQCARGNQYQYCVNTSTPTTASMLVWPVRDCRDTVTFRPPVITKKTTSLDKKQTFASVE